MKRKHERATKLRKQHQPRNTYPAAEVEVVDNFGVPDNVGDSVLNWTDDEEMVDDPKTAVDDVSDDPANMDSADDPMEVDDMLDDSDNDDLIVDLFNADGSLDDPDYDGVVDYPDEAGGVTGTKAVNVLE